MPVASFTQLPSEILLVLLDFLSDAGLNARSRRHAAASITRWNTLSTYEMRVRETPLPFNGQLATEW